LKDKIEGKEIKRMRDDYACEGEKSKNKENEEKKILFIPRTRLLRLD
jgi:hypothetical protein